MLFWVYIANVYIKLSLTTMHFWFFYIFYFWRNNTFVYFCLVNKLSLFLFNRSSLCFRSSTAFPMVLEQWSIISFTMCFKGRNGIQTAAFILCATKEKNYTFRHIFVHWYLGTTPMINHANFIHVGPFQYKKSSILYKLPLKRLTVW